MKRDTIAVPLGKCQSSFLSCEKDCQKILELLFVKAQPYSDTLKKLLVINNSDCLDVDSENQAIYNNLVHDMSLKILKQKGHIKIIPKITMPEHEELMSYIIISFDNFMETNNPQFRDCTITFDILCHTDCWDLGGFQLRPLKIAGYIDGILNNAKLSGIGKLDFLGCKQLLLDETLGGYSLTYRAIHGSDDKIPNED